MPENKDDAQRAAEAQLEDILRSFSAKAEALKREYLEEAQKILKQINERKINELKKELGI
jgi:L-asparaginase II